MSRINAMFFLVVALSSVCFGATLMQISVAQNAPDKAQGVELTPSCRKLVQQFEHEGANLIAKKIYEQAYVESFNGKKTAKDTALCARSLIMGQQDWKYGPEIFSH